MEDYMTLKRVDPMYRLQYKGNKVLKLYNDEKQLVSLTCFKRN
ncbi:hypothetical protein [Desulfitibacter alkalitolerans]|nr:hypothetical protein [Desulfitibacter alkalitolerans]